VKKLPSIDVFGSGAIGRDLSGAKNDERESAIELLLSDDASKRDLLLRHPVHGAKWVVIQGKFLTAVKNFMATGGYGVPASSGHLASVTRQGGRSRNYDFDGSFVSGSGATQLIKIELKRGTSIYEQPQFLQLYAKHGDMITGAIQPYSAWFFDNYISEVAQLAGVNAPSKSEYLKKCFGTEYEVFDHTNVLYRLNIRGSSVNKALQTLAFTSIDGYLGILESNHSYVDLKAIQERLNAQLGKLFVSWDPASQDFAVEVFSKDSMTLTSSIATKKRRNGQRSCLVFTNKAGHPIQALLRWKNHNCLLGPAWQISLSAN
jgi:hypothetical protein